MARWLLHVDLDQFQAAVEFRRRPELRGLPVIVGGNGDPTEPRRVVTCASYPARAFGVHAGMPLRSAARKCPEAVFLPLDMAAYESASSEVMAVLREHSDGQVEVWGWDEAFVGTDIDDPEQLAAEIRTAIVDLGLTCAVGIGDNKTRAKMATGFAKSPGPGIFRLTVTNWTELMADRPTEALWGVGRRIAMRMANLEIHTVAQLAAADLQVLATEFGPNTGPWLRALGRGGGGTDVVTEPRIPVGRSHSQTFARDLTERSEMEAEVARLATVVAEETAAENRTVVRVAVTVRTNTFYTRSKQRKLAAPTADVSEVVAAAVEVLGRFELDRPVRLLGVRVELTPLDEPPDG